MEKHVVNKSGDAAGAAMDKTEETATGIVKNGDAGKTVLIK